MYDPCHHVFATPLSAQLGTTINILKSLKSTCMLCVSFSEHYYLMNRRPSVAIWRLQELLPKQKGHQGLDKGQSTEAIGLWPFCLLSLYIQVCCFKEHFVLIIIIIFKVYIAPLTYKIIKGAEHMLKSTEWNKKTKKKDWSPGQCPNKSMGIRLSRQQRTNSY